MIKGLLQYSQTYFPLYWKIVSKGALQAAIEIGIKQYTIKFITSKTQIINF